MSSDSPKVLTGVSVLLTAGFPRPTQLALQGLLHSPGLPSSPFLGLHGKLSKFLYPLLQTPFP